MVGSLRGAPEFAALAGRIRELSAAREFLYFPLTGNWGDSLIRAGTVQFFANENLPHRTWYNYDFISKTFSFRFPPRARWSMDENKIAQLAEVENLAVIGGGGGWCPPYHATRRLADALSRYCKHVVVLPHSYVLPPLDGEITYYCRDKDYSHQSVSNAVFCHDMAFYLEPRPREAFKEIGLFFRGDRESKFGLGGVSGNLDVSRMDNELGDPEGFFDIIGRYEVIATDRLHVAIAGALLGRQTYVVGGTYWKIRSVFESSFRGNYPNVEFFDTPSELPVEIRKLIQT